MTTFVLSSVNIPNVLTCYVVISIIYCNRYYTFTRGFSAYWWRDKICLHILCVYFSNKYDIKFTCSIVIKGNAFWCYWFSVITLKFVTIWFVIIYMRSFNFWFWNILPKWKTDQREIFRWAILTHEVCLTTRNRLKGFIWPINRQKYIKFCKHLHLILPITCVILFVRVKVLIRPTLHLKDVRYKL